MKKVLLVGSAWLADPGIQVRLQAIALASFGHGQVSTNARAMSAVSSYCHHANTAAFQDENHAENRSNTAIGITHCNRIKFIFERRKGGWRVATRYDRYPNVFFSTIYLAATVIFWL
ncbi:hypothetical protein JK185_11750 [Gluconobacter wancherniae]|nr:hypothetical protein [Gluconobacter wancherniae]